jgi:hypothetical protein
MSNMCNKQFIIVGYVFKLSRRQSKSKTKLTRKRTTITLNRGVKKISRLNKRKNGRKIEVKIRKARID